MRHSNVFGLRTDSNLIHIPPGCVSNRRDSPTACKTVHRTVLHPRCARAGLSSPLSCIKKLRYPNGYLSFLVRERGLEPPRRNHTHLKRACLPFQHSRSCLNIITGQGVFVNPFFSKSLLNAWLPVHSSPFLCHMRHNSKAPISAPKPQRRSHRSGSR